MGEPKSVATRMIREYHEFIEEQCTGDDAHSFPFCSLCKQLHDRLDALVVELQKEEKAND